MPRVRMACVFVVLIAACDPGGPSEVDELDELEEESELTAPGLIHVLDTTLGILREGDRFVHARTALGFRVPRASRGVFGEVIREDGSTGELRVETDGNGDVRVFATAEPAQAAAAAAAPPSACSDRARSIAGWRWNSAYAWYFNGSSVPSSFSADGAEAALRAAATNITRSDNDCGLADQVSATHSYRGRTDRRPNIGADGACGESDGRNVIGFGDLPAGTLGLACVWYSLDGAAVEADVKLNRADHAWVLAIPAGCRDKFHVEAIATHELGHVFGLGHVSEATHGRLTMSTRAAPCQRSETTLGRGDIIGLRLKY